MTTYYLSSLDSVKFGETRRCEVTKVHHLSTGKPCLLVKVSPPVSLQERGLIGDLEGLVLVSRHEGQDIVAPTVFPVFVFIARLLSEVDDAPISKDNLEILAWGEIYRTKDDADNHRFDTKRMVKS